MSGYKHYYFPARARAEISRLALSAAHIDFEDIRLNLEEWTREKASGRPPLGQMPFLVTPEGNVLAQSGAIMRYICKKAGLSPADSFDEALADMIHDGATDLRETMLNFLLYEKDEVKRAELKNEFFETTLPARLEKYEALLKSRDEGKGFFFGDKLTYADISFFDFLNSFLSKGEPTVPEQLKKFPLLEKHYDRVLSVPEIKAWVEKRPVTEF